MERRKYPIHAEEYELYEEVGQGVSACVYKARCIPLNEIVAIKVIDFEKHNSDLRNISREAQTLTLVDHPNVLNAHCSFVNDHTLWIVMPYMAGGSCLHILKSAYPDGFEEAVIATLLREALKGLEYLHQHGHIHRDAGNILVDGRGGVKLGDFGVSACLFDSGDRQRTRNTFVGTPCWADIWSFGITALELAHGHAPFPNPRKRPSSTKLLKHSFFKQARSSDFICRSILEGLPSLGDRIRALKVVFFYSFILTFTLSFCHSFKRKCDS
ncbi:unnamed protein product [Spirodela intermedia]|uniref:Protein kinase domain-containing protein n=1 Tax=Spirodela intermedia TaxID=51605 RepID=A0A7I8JK93_SPIIN|nr:unnamed protein product [Spirodela intermedia]CAA6670271.1 unnamed protein product [Spirodela intermedia]